MQDRIFDMLMKEDEITWQTILYDLVKSEEMDPWDIDISILSKKYLETVRKLQEMNFAISGKIVLASAILLKIKTQRLIEEDMVKFESLINPPEEFILNKLRNHKPTWLFKNADEAIKNYEARKPLHQNLDFDFAYTFDTSKPDLDEQIEEATKIINSRI